jgi:hypothetical protein
MPLVADDLALKRKKMAKDPFLFLRGSFFRWAEVWPSLCPDLAQAPGILGVGDLHIENFGTWRDAEGRLVWGVNDFDEATYLPYTNDLVRLCTSVLLAIGETGLTISPKRACEAVLQGYRRSLDTGGEPIVLAERHRRLRDIAETQLEDENEYWKKLLNLKPVNRSISPPVRRVLQRAMPKESQQLRIVHRIGGLASLGRQRFTAIAPWRGGLVAREAKRLTESCWIWYKRTDRPGPIRYMKVADQAVRVGDPFLHLRGRWIVRRLAPDCRRIDLHLWPQKRDVAKLLEDMGWETANVHLGTATQRRAICNDLQRRNSSWLLHATRIMADDTLRDWRQWKSLFFQGP